jgi:hypothetical protein
VGRYGIVYTEVLEQPEDLAPRKSNFPYFISSEGFLIEVRNSVQLSESVLFLIGRNSSITTHRYSAGTNLNAVRTVEKAQRAIAEYNERFGVVPLED